MSEPVTLDRSLSLAARSLAFRYSAQARQASDSPATLLCYGTLALGR